MKKQLGLTLVELMVSLAAVAILIGIAVPSFKSFSTSGKKSAAVNSLTGAFAIARSEAVTRNARMTLAANGADWAAGWTLSETTSGTQVKVGNPIPATMVTVTNTGPTTVEFNSDGTLRTALAGGFAIELCETGRPANSPGKQIVLNVSGRYSVDPYICP